MKKIKQPLYIYAICMTLGIIIGISLLILGTTYTSSAREVSILSVDNNTISYISSINNGDPDIRTIPKPKFGKYQKEDKIYVDEEKNKVVKFHLEDDTLDTIKNIGIAIIVITFGIPYIILILGIIWVFIFSTETYMKFCFISFLMGIVLVWLSSELNEVGYLYGGILQFAIGIIFGLISNYKNASNKKTKR